MFDHRLPRLSDGFHHKTLTLGLIASLAFVALSQNNLYAQGSVVSKVTAWAKGHGKPPAP